MVVEGQVVASRDEAEVFEFRSRVGISEDVTPQVEEDPAPVGHAEQGYFDVGEIVLFAGVVVVVAEEIGFVVEGLVAAVVHEGFQGEIAFEGGFLACCAGAVVCC